MLNKSFNPYPTIYKWNKMSIGFAAGLVGPIVGIFAFYLMKINEVTPEVYWQMLHNKIFLSPMLSFGCIMNLVIFFLFLRKDFYNSARGVIFATFIWAIPIIYTKFF
jgi:ABC-type spermidine/putrescine transport system permease subunit II